MRVLIAPDKFKGSLSADAAACAMRDGWLAVRPGDAVQCVPISDGGEGFAEVCGMAVGATREVLQVAGPLGSRVDAVVWRLSGEVWFETASACGLGLVPAAMRNPANTSTRGVGEVFGQLARHGVEHVLAGLGGSATNDGGFGMAVALGYRFLDQHGGELPQSPLELNRLARVVPPSRCAWPRVSAAVDVTNPFLGPRGCTGNFGYQKGLREMDAAAFEDALGRLEEVVRRDLGKAVANLPGSGAAGGLGFGLSAFCDAELVAGFDLVADAIGLKQMVVAADVILTGEGSLDMQSLAGKAPVALARMATAFGRPVFCVAGSIDSSVDWGSLFTGSRSLLARAGSADEAISRASHWVSGAVREFAREWKSCPQRG